MQQCGRVHKVIQLGVIYSQLLEYTAQNLSNTAGLASLRVENGVACCLVTKVPLVSANIN